MNFGPATSAGPTHHPVIVDIIRKVRFNCMILARHVERARWFQ